MFVEAREAAAFNNPSTFSHPETRKISTETNKNTWKETAAGVIIASAGVYLMYRGLTDESIIRGAIFFGIGTYLLINGINKIRHKP